MASDSVEHAPMPRADFSEVNWRIRSPFMDLHFLTHGSYWAPGTPDVIWAAIALAEKLGIVTQVRLPPVRVYSTT